MITQFIFETLTFYRAQNALRQRGEGQELKEISSKWVRPNDRTDKAGGCQGKVLMMKATDHQSAAAISLLAEKPEKDFSNKDSTPHLISNCSWMCRSSERS